MEMEGGVADEEEYVSAAPISLQVRNCLSPETVFCAGRGWGGGAAGPFGSWANTRLPRSGERRVRGGIGCEATRAVRVRRGW